MVMETTKMNKYFKVQVMWTQIFETVVKADDADAAKNKVLLTDEWIEDDPISQGTSVYNVYELVEKPDE